MPGRIEAPSGGVSLVGNAPGKFHAYAVFDDGAIHHLRYDEGWTGTSEAYGDDFVGTPSARLANAEWLDVFARTADGALWDLYAWFTPPQLAYYFTEDAADNTVRYPSDPAVASWKPTRIATPRRNCTRSPRISTKCASRNAPPWRASCTMNSGRC
jgi:hypothetical protein